jgi:pimeloyl-ACP methyl ester carboxylesterase
VPFDDATWSLFDEAANSDENRRTIIDYSTGNRLPMAWIKGVADNSRRTSSQKAFRAYLASWARTDFHQEIVGNTVPLKVIVGAHDPSITADVMQATFLKWFPNSSLEVMKNAGHYPMDEMPISLASSIEGFLRSA